MPLRTLLCLVLLFLLLVLLLLLFLLLLLDVLVLIARFGTCLGGGGGRGFRGGPPNNSLSDVGALDLTLRILLGGGGRGRELVF